MTNRSNKHGGRMHAVLRGVGQSCLEPPHHPLPGSCLQLHPNGASARSPPRYTEGQ